MVKQPQFLTAQISLRQFWFYCQICICMCSIKSDQQANSSCYCV